MRDTNTRKFFGGKNKLFTSNAGVNNKKYIRE